MSVEVRTTVSFHPFPVPDGARYALPDFDPLDMPMIALEDLPLEALDALAMTWLNNLYANVAKPNPFALVRGEPK